MKNRTLGQKISYICYRIFRFALWLFYPKVTINGTEKLPDEPCIIMANHSQMHGPIAGELYFPGNKKIWCASQMMHLKDVPAYAFEDFWSKKPKATLPFFKLLSYLIAPLSACIFSNASTIGVYRDSRIISTFKKTVSALQNGDNVVIFPECYEPYNHIVTQFQENFVSVAKLYYKRTGKCLSFVPMYIAPKLKAMYLGIPTVYSPDAPEEEERRRICRYAMDTITEMAQALPRHTVIPYPNISPKLYATNIQEVSQDEKTRC